MQIFHDKVTFWSNLTKSTVIFIPADVIYASEKLYRFICRVLLLFVHLFCLLICLHSIKGFFYWSFWTWKIFYTYLRLGTIFWFLQDLKYFLKGDTKSQITGARRYNSILSKTESSHLIFSANLRNWAASCDSIWFVFYRIRIRIRIMISK